jgi:DNA-nicking Smr family endonuclease
MSRRSGRSGGERTGTAPASPRARALNAPFADLGKRLRGRPVAAPPRPAPSPAEARPATEPDEPALFASAMREVVPLPSDMRARVAGPGPAAAGVRPPVSEEAEVLAELSDLVAGATAFDISDTREYVEGAVVGLDPRLLRRLRRGEFALQAHLDLHGLTADEARPAVDGFLTAAARAQHRCVLIVHGRGLNSKDQVPVLKERLKIWLARGRAAHVVLAFATARPCDGGAGALYVLLRRDRGKRPIRVTEGAKR